MMMAKYEVLLQLLAPPKYFPGTKSGDELRDSRETRLEVPVSRRSATSNLHLEGTALYEAKVCDGQLRLDFLRNDFTNPIPTPGRVVWFSTRRHCFHAPHRAVFLQFLAN